MSPTSSQFNCTNVWAIMFLHKFYTQPSYTLIYHKKSNKNKFTKTFNNHVLTNIYNNHDLIVSNHCQLAIATPQLAKESTHKKSSCTNTCNHCTNTYNQWIHICNQESIHTQAKFHQVPALRPMVDINSNQQLSHNANNLPIWHWWQPSTETRSSSILSLPLWHQWQRVNKVL